MRENLMFFRITLVKLEATNLVPSKVKNQGVRGRMHRWECTDGNALDMFIDAIKTGFQKMHVT